MRCIFIINPVSGKGAALHLEAGLRSTLQNSGCDWEIYHTKGPGDAEKFVRRQAAEKPGWFFACGGDGTLHEVVEGVRDFPDSAAGVIPAGTGNDFVRSFADPAGFSDPLRQIRGTVHSLDLIQAGKQIAVNMINIGFDCEVVAWVQEHRDFPLCRGSFAYLLGLLVIFLRRLGTSLSFCLENEKEQEGRYLLCTIANGQYCGGGFHSSPRAFMDDGLMDFAIIKKMRRIRFLSLLGDYQKGTYLETPSARKYLTVKKCGELTISAPGGGNVCIDGEIYPFTKLDVKILPKAFNFIIPAEN